MSEKLAVIFDVDGVLVDSYDAHYDSWQEFCCREDWQMTHQQFVDTFGRTSRETILETWPNLADSPDRVAEIDAQKEEIFREIMVRDFPAMPGAVDLIDALAAAGFSLAVGSSGPPPNVQLVLDNLDRAASFGAVITGTDVTRGKPDPQVFQLGAERLGTQPTKTIVIEDAPAGIVAAHAAGMKCIALCSTGRNVGELDAAELTVHNLNELTPEIIRKVILG